MPSLVADRGEAYAVFSRCADRRHSNRWRVQLGFDRRFGFSGTFPPQVFGLSNLHRLIADEDVDQRRSSAADDDAVKPRALEFQSKMAGGEGVADEAGERGLGDSAKLGSGSEAGANQWGAGQYQRVVGRKGLDSHRRVVVKQARTEAEAAKERAEPRLL